MIALLLVDKRYREELHYSFNPPIFILSFDCSRIIFMKRNIYCREEKYFLS